MTQKDKTSNGSDDVRVDVQSENGTGTLGAQVLVYFGDKLVTTVVGKIEPQKGADGNMYPTIHLEKLDA